MKPARLLFRAWYYFRTGFSTYLSFLFGFATTIVTVYYLAINNLPALKTVFHSFWLFTVFAVGVGVPLSVLAGYLHFKRTRAYSSEVDITVEQNPYYYKMTPGKEKEMAVPLAIASIELSLAMARKLKVLTPEIEAEYLRVRDLYARLLKYGDYRQQDTSS